MRFPDIPPMARTIDLFKRLGLEKDLVKYHMKTKDDLRYFNGVRASRGYVDMHKCEDVFGASLEKGGSVPMEFVAQGADYWVLKKIWPFKAAYKRNKAEFFTMLLKYDMYSMREFMRTTHEELYSDDSVYPKAVGKEGPKDRAYPESVRMGECP
jgi:hypothetical protein